MAELGAATRIDNAKSQALFETVASAFDSAQAIDWPAVVLTMLRAQRMCSGHQTRGQSLKPNPNRSLCFEKGLALSVMSGYVKGVAQSAWCLTRSVLKVCLGKDYNAVNSVSTKGEIDWVFIISNSFNSILLFLLDTHVWNKTILPKASVLILCSPMEGETEFFLQYSPYLKMSFEGRVTRE